MRSSRLWPLALPLMASTLAMAREPWPPVNPFVGTAGDHGQLAPAATGPYGMVQLSPDTVPAGHAGYDYRASELRGFSHTRAQGVGCGGAGGDLLVAAGYDGDGDRWPIDKASEAAGAGWYRVRYGRIPIEAQLVARDRTGVSRFIFSKAGIAEIVIDPRHGYTTRLGASWDHRVASQLAGTMSTTSVCDRGAYRLAFAATLARNGIALPDIGHETSGNRLRFRIPVHPRDAIELRVAFSVTDIASARRALAVGVGNQPFASLRRTVAEDWQRELGRVRVSGGTAKQRRLFYTHLFRVMQSPTRIDDDDGRYRLSNGDMARAPDGHHRYTGWSIWDNYRTQLPLIALLDPRRAQDVAASIAELYRAGKTERATDREPFITIRTEHAGIILLDYWRKGLRGFAPDQILPLMAGEIAHGAVQSPDRRIEAAYDAWAVSELAHDIGDGATADRFRQLATAYRPEWNSVFRDPTARDGDVVKARGLYQGTIWQYRWAPVFDLLWLIETALGRERFGRELTRFFDRKLFNMTNQPDIHTPYLFTLIGRADRTQAIVDRILNQPMEHWYTNRAKRIRPWIGRSFADDPAGFAEGMDDDVGTMAGWYVWASLGLYPLVIGEPWYLISAPTFLRAVIALPDGRTLEIERHGHGRIVASARFAGRPLPALRIAHATLMRGGKLVIAMTDRPHATATDRHERQK
ncbi:glycoside hydrolase family 92 protein [Sphingomonadaceae bacterium jetA1]|jgi:putative alpha-1,2-mannosidase|uniref:glycoside hydrolase domain-containing protein n=1 Tax=Facivitalis istanbulensis TaxID=3075838 RepID=UPI00347B2D98